VTDHEVLEAVLAELHVIHGLLEARSQTPGLSRADRELLERVLPAVAGVKGPEWFTTNELLASDAPAVRLVLADLSAKRVGRLFSRGVGQSVDGYVVERGGEEAHRVQWRIRQAVE
jgi:hypothetical protein